MATVKNTVSYTLRSDILWGVPIPVYHWVDADVGRAVLYEQRHWLSSMRLADVVDYRKREKRAGYIGKCICSWGLLDIDFLSPTEEPSSFNTNMFTTPMLLAWLFAKQRHFEAGRDEDKVARCGSALEAACRMLQHGFSLCERPPEIVVNSALLSIDNRGEVDVSRLRGEYPELRGEWAQLRDSGAAWHLAPLPEGGVVPFAQLFRFWGRDSTSPLTCPCTIGCELFAIRYC